MKTLKLLLVILMTSLMSQQAFATVTITPPVKPEGVTESIVSGQEYYLYNTLLDNYVSLSGNNLCFGTDRVSFVVEILDDGYYCFGRDNGTEMRYVESYHNYVYWNYTNSKDNVYAKFNVVKDGLSYKIQNIPENGRYYDANSWWGMRDNNYGHVYYNGTAYTTWMFCPKDADEDAFKLYASKCMLYDEIVAADAKGNPILYYENIYKNGAFEDIKKAVKELHAIESYSEAAQCIVPAWNDYPIQLYSENFGTYNNEAIRRAVFGRNTYGQTKTMSANVVITEPSVLVFNVHSNDHSNQSVLFPIDVYVDGVLTYSYRGDIYHQYWTEYRHNSYSEQNTTYSSSGYRRLFTELPDVGEHRIDIVFTNNIDDNNEHAIAFNTFGIEKTPLITVNVAEAGELGYEIERAMDQHPSYQSNPDRNIRDVRRLKISGKLNDTDFEKIKSMTSLFALDLADTDVKEIKDKQFDRYESSHLNFFHHIVLPKGLTKVGNRAFIGTYIDVTDIPESVESIGYNAFADTYINKAIMPNVKNIGEYAFYNCPHLKEVKTEILENIERKAFQYNINLEKVDLQGSFTVLPWSTLCKATSLTELNLPNSIEIFEKYSLERCSNVPIIKLPENVKTIGVGAFLYCNIDGKLPNSIQSIGNQAFMGAKVVTNDSTLYLPANATYGSEEFRYSNVKNVVIPGGYYSLTPSLMFANSDSLKSIKLLSPTKTTVAANFVEGLNKDEIELCVPKHLYYEYKLDDYWMDFKIETFSTTELDSIVIRQDLTLSKDYRFEGTHDLAIESGVKFGIQGVAGMDLKNVALSSDLNADSYSQITSGTDNITISGLTSERLYTKANKWYFLSLPFDCNLSQTVNENEAQYAIRYYNGASRAKVIDRALYPYPESAHEYPGWLNEDSEGNKQTFTYPNAQKLLLQFNSKCKVQDGPYNDLIHIRDGNGNETTYDDRELADATVLIDGNTFDIWITSDGWGIQGYGYSIDYIYADPEDGVNYKAWTNYDCTKDIIPAGTGFIFMTSKDSWTRFYSVDNGTKKRVFENSENEKNEFHYTLQKNPSETSANRGWNLVGNPFPNYYNYHKLSFTAPITIWNGTTYQALSLIDDNDKIALKPYQAFFVQCPESTNEISFPVAGRQLSSEIKEEANARPMNMVNGSRQLVDLTLSGNGGSDRTRVVMNEEASAQYEMQCDAAKFMSMDNSVPQLYSLDASTTKYSINERPYAEEGVKLGVYIPVAGEYTLALTRNRADKVMLLDNETGMTINIMEGEYTFEAEAGTYENRFVLIFENGATSIGHVNAQNDIMASDRIFTPEGIEVKQMLSGKTYIIRGKNGVRKVMLK